MEIVCCSVPASCSFSLNTLPLRGKGKNWVKVIRTFYFLSIGLQKVREYKWDRGRWHWVWLIKNNTQHDCNGWRRPEEPPTTIGYTNIWSSKARAGGRAPKSTSLRSFSSLIWLIISCKMHRLCSQSSSSLMFVLMYLWNEVWDLQEMAFLRKLMSHLWTFYSQVVWAVWGWSHFRRLNCFLRRDFDRPGRSAGSADDVRLGNLVFEEFKKQDMDPWTDIHYVQLQTPDRLIWRILFTVLDKWINSDYLIWGIFPQRAGFYQFSFLTPYKTISLLAGILSNCFQLVWLWCLHLTLLVIGVFMRLSWKAYSILY